MNIEKLFADIKTTRHYLQINYIYVINDNISIKTTDDEIELETKLHIKTEEHKNVLGKLIAGNKEYDLDILELEILLNE